MKDTVSALSAGDRIRNYEIQCLAGKGGMGFVYRALDTEFGGQQSSMTSAVCSLTSYMKNDSFLGLCQSGHGPNWNN